MSSAQLTPKEILRSLDEYVVGQTKAKRAVAVALRNRWRRRQLPEDVATDVYPKNILLIGPTGVGKTEIARRLAGLASAPFVKVEASKYSEVGYHGRDVESMVRDLMDASVALVRREKVEEVQPRARQHADQRILAVLMQERSLLDPMQPPGSVDAGPLGSGAPELDALGTGGLWRPDSVEAYGESAESPVELARRAEERDAAGKQLQEQLVSGALDAEVIEIEMLDSKTPTLSIQGPQGNETMGIDAQALQEMWGRSPAQRTKIRKLSVEEAREILIEEEADKLLDQDVIVRDAIDRAENDGIVFLDEIDKVIGGGNSDGPDVSREGVQRDLLPIVEGCAVYTRYGHVRTDHILFIAAGAFHFHKPSELIPELQGRFPVRVALQPLTEADFVRILTEPRNSLVRQYTALFSTEDVGHAFHRRRRAAASPAAGVPRQPARPRTSAPGGC